MLQLGLALDDVLCARCAAPQWLEHPTLRDSVTILSRCGLNFVACIFFVLHSQAVSWELIVDIASAGELAAVAASGYMACLAHEPVTAGRLLPLSYTLVALLFQIVACLQDAGAIAWRPAAVFAPLWLLALTVLGAACVFASFRCGEIGNEMRSARVDLRLQRQRLSAGLLIGRLDAAQPRQPKPGQPGQRHESAPTQRARHAYRSPSLCARYLSVIHTVQIEIHIAHLQFRSMQAPQTAATSGATCPVIARPARGMLRMPTARLCTPRMAITTETCTRARRSSAAASLPTSRRTSRPSPTGSSSRGKSSRKVRAAPAVSKLTISVIRGCGLH